MRTIITQISFFLLAMFFAMGLQAQTYIYSFAGNGTMGYAGDNGPAASAELNLPTGLFVDKANNVYIADQYNHRVRKVSASTGKINWVAGDGTPGYTGD